jgi:hypothetical protein
MQRLLAGLAVAALLIMVTIWPGSWHTVAPVTRQPAPVGDTPGEIGGDGFSQRRRAWYEAMHRAAPGVQWAAMDARELEARATRQAFERAALLARGAGPEEFQAIDSVAISGSWSERGSSNQAGRVTATLYDAVNNRLTALSHGGNLWRAPRATLAWAAPGTATFLPTGSNGFAERLVGGASGERILVAGDRPDVLRYSDNGGISFTSSAGATLANPWYTMGLVARDEAAGEVYFMRVHYDFTAPADWKPQLFASVDRGASFSARGFVGLRDQVALYSPRYGVGAGAVFLLAGTSLRTITTGTHALVNVSTVPLTPALASGDSVALTGGVTAGGQTFLYALYSRGGGANRTDVYFSGNGGVSWTARVAAPTSMFGLNAAESSTRDPNRLFVGGVDTYRSADGAATWTLVNPWADYYAAPATKLHADVPAIDVFVDAGGNERVYIATDGGLYESTDYALTVNNLSLSGLNVSQYYDVYTRRTPPHHVVVGAQDQGYQKAVSPGIGVLPFTQVISGDYAHLSSADGGLSLWSVYPTFAMYDLASGNTTNSSLRYYDFALNNVTGTLFLPPLATLPGAPNRILLAGGRVGAGSSHTILELNYNAGLNSISATVDGANFVDPVTAIAVSPHAGNTRYAVATPAGAFDPSTRFYRRPAAGTWTQTVTSLPNGQFFYGSCILPDPAMSGRVYLAGSGYGNGNGNSVYVSNDDGVSFQPMAAGLPPTLVTSLAISTDGLHLFAAAETGAYYYDRATSTWVDIVALGAPNQIYWDVDYVDTLGLARFATYGRGIWDFTVAGPALIFANGFE